MPDWRNQIERLTGETEKCSRCGLGPEDDNAEEPPGVLLSDEEAPERSLVELCVVCGRELYRFTRLVWGDEPPGEVDVIYR